ncbi:MAG: hypothetical protein E7095_04635 [Bacteroides sp.]|nr:hypothetical protein [Bacteroides sp.]
MKMKSAFNWWLLLWVMVFVAACSDGGEEIDKPDTPPTPEQPTITLDTSSSDFTTNGGSNTVSFTALADWTAEVINSRADAWCSVSPTSGKAGNAQITITTTANDTPDNRSASVILKAGTTQKTITVSQKQKDALTVTSDKFEVSAEGGEIKIEVKANIDYEYSIAYEGAAKDWIISGGARALKTSTLTFKVAANEEVEKREATVTIKSGSFKEEVKVYQAGTTPSITLTKNEFVVASAGESIAVEVKSNVDVTVELPTDVDWISENQSRAMSTNTYHFTIAESQEYDQRTAEIKFTNKANNLSETVKVVQVQKDAIVVAKNEYEFKAEGGELDFEILTNVDVTVSIPDSISNWVKQVKSRALVSQILHFDISPCDLSESRSGTITLSGGNAVQKILIKQDGLKEILEAERNALIAFYNAMNGDSWHSIWGHEDVKNKNWCSKEPLSTWAGVTTNSQGRVTELRLPGCYLTGTIPSEIGNLTELEVLQLNSNNITGELPKELFNLKKLRILCLMTNWITGKIPEEIGNLTNLTELWLHQNGFTGAIPESLMKLTKLEDLRLCENPLFGNLPESFYEWDFWKNWWGMSLIDTKYKFEDINLPGPIATITCFDGKTIDLKEEYKNNKYTILFQWSLVGWETNEILPQMKSIHALYADKGIKIIGWANSNIDTKDSAITYINESGMPWDNFYYNCSDFNESHNYEHLENTFGTLPWYPANYCTSITVVDTNGKIVFSDIFGDRNKVYQKDGYLMSLVENDFIIKEKELYESTDYSLDATVVTLQKATKGNGIDVVLMGDGYSDRKIADGTYKADMEYIYNNLFTEEPYKSFKDHFNVYYVNVVSENEVFLDYSNTALGGFFGEGTLVGGNDNTVFVYALNAISGIQMNEALIIVAMNSDNYAGTCYMYQPTSIGDYGSGPSVSYFPKGGNAETFAQLLHHEACGHGFAKLADEYAYEDMGAIPADVANSHKEQQNTWGWWKNVDFTSDPSATRWSHFINDTRYANDGLGAYEGGLTYWTGVWRPTENSTMRYNTGGFNAPSREAIYYRIHKLAYGDSWQYDYEEFVKYDAINRKAAASSYNPYRQTNYKPLHAPVVIRKSWKDAK